MKSQKFPRTSLGFPAGKHRNYRLDWLKKIEQHTCLYAELYFNINIYTYINTVFNNAHICCYLFNFSVINLREQNIKHKIT